MTGEALRGGGVFYIFLASVANASRTKKLRPSWISAEGDDEMLK